MSAVKRTSIFPISVLSWDMRTRSANMRSRNMQTHWCNYVAIREDRSFTRSVKTLRRRSLSKEMTCWLQQLNCFIYIDYTLLCFLDVRYWTRVLQWDCKQTEYTDRFIPMVTPIAEIHTDSKMIRKMMWTPITSMSSPSKRMISTMATLPRNVKFNSPSSARYLM